VVVLAGGSGEGKGRALLGNVRPDPSSEASQRGHPFAEKGGLRCAQRDVSSSVLRADGDKATCEVEFPRTDVGDLEVSGPAKRENDGCRPKRVRGMQSSGCEQASDLRWGKRI